MPSTDSGVRRSTKPAPCRLTSARQSVLARPPILRLRRAAGSALPERSRELAVRSRPSSVNHLAPGAGLFDECRGCSLWADLLKQVRDRFVELVKVKVEVASISPVPRVRDTSLLGRGSRGDHNQVWQSSPPATYKYAKLSANILRSIGPKGAWRTRQRAHMRGTAARRVWQTDHDVRPDVIVAGNGAKKLGELLEAVMTASFRRTRSSSRV